MATKKKKRATARKANASPARRTKKAAPASKRGRKRTVARRGKPRAVKRVAARKPVRPKAALRKKAALPKQAAPVKKAAVKKAAAGTRAAPWKTKRRPAVRRGRGAAGFDVEEPLDPRGLGSESGGQSGDTEGLSRAELADSESVEELLEEGQAFEAGIVSGVENAPDADEGEIRTREVPEDDVPKEYLDED
jgi:hypothetical protein